MNGEVSRADLRIAGLKNDLSELRPEYRKVKIRLFQPTEPLPFDSLDFDPRQPPQDDRSGIFPVSGLRCPIESMAITAS